MVKEYLKKIKELGIGKLLLILLAGILLVLSYTVDTSEAEKSVSGTSQHMDKALYGEDDLEYSMEQLLMSINGVTDADVMITYEDSGEKILVSSKSTDYEKSDEQDSAGGVRTQEKQNTSEEYLYAGESPYVVMETKPAICGVVVVYSGEESLTKDITEAVKVLTGADYNRIKVLFMN